MIDKKIVYFNFNGSSVLCIMQCCINTFFIFSFFSD